MAIVEEVNADSGWKKGETVYPQMTQVAEQIKALPLVELLDFQTKLTDYILENHHQEVYEYTEKKIADPFGTLSEFTIHEVVNKTGVHLSELLNKLKGTGKLEEFDEFRHFCISLSIHNLRALRISLRFKSPQQNEAMQIYFEAIIRDKMGISPPADLAKPC
jgi:hypothetical protein